MESIQIHIWGGWAISFILFSVIGFLVTLTNAIDAFTIIVKWINKW